MRAVMLIYVCLGVGLLVWTLLAVDLQATGLFLRDIGWLGALAVFATALAAFVADTITWHLAIDKLPLALRWGYVVWRIRMVGEAFNFLIPAGGFGGEPVKAVLLKRHHDIAYGEGIASIILARTINLLALLVFLSIGFGLLAIGTDVDPAITWAALAGLFFLGFGITLIFSVQRFKGMSRLISKIANRSSAGRLKGILQHIEAMDARLHGFYVNHPKRFLVSFGLALFNWVLGAAEAYLVLSFAGIDVTFEQALMIEAIVQMVRAATFFIPANLGSQEGAFVLMTQALLGSADAGLVLAAARRVREIVFASWGMGIGSGYSLKALMKQARDVQSPSS